MPTPDDELGPSAHGGVHRGRGKLPAIDTIRGIRGDASHDVTRIDVLQRELEARLLEMRLDPVGQKDADIDELHVAGCISDGRVGQPLLAGSFGDHDDRVPALLKPGPELLEECRTNRLVDRHLGNEAEVHVAGRQRCVARQEPAVATHQLHKSDAVEGAARLGVRAADRLDGLGNRRLEPEALVEVEQVVVDGLGNAVNGDWKPPATRLRRNGDSRPHRAVTADDVEYVYSKLD